MVIEKIFINKGRDKDKIFLINEPYAIEGEALINGIFDLTATISDFRALSNLIMLPEGEAIYDKLLDYVHILPDNEQPRPLRADDIREVATALYLRSRVFSTLKEFCLSLLKIEQSRVRRTGTNGIKLKQASLIGGRCGAVIMAKLATYNELKSVLKLSDLLVLSEMLDIESDNQYLINQARERANNKGANFSYKTY